MTNPLEQIRELEKKWYSQAAESLRKGMSSAVYDKGAASAYQQCAHDVLAILTASQGYMCVPVEIIQQNAEDVKEWEEFGRQIEKRLRHNDLGLTGGYPEMIDALLEKAMRLRALERAMDERPDTGIVTAEWVKNRADEILREGELHDQD